ncbi:MAG: hypothetical protein J6A79_12425 [Clostridia bacterium]|nr:hypothetical protein [Clostridia bacterium]
MYNVVKRNGEMVVFDIRKIAEAIRAATEMEREVDREIDRYTDGLYLGCLDAKQQEEIVALLNEQKREAKKQRKYLIQKMNRILQTAWLHRNTSAGRSNTSSVSDKMLLTIPTPPTAETANRSLWQRGMACGAAA